MSLGGGTRVSAFTITLAVTLVFYTLIGAGISATFNGTAFINPYGGNDLNIDLVADFVDYDYHNITEPSLFSYTQVIYEDLSPDGAVRWVSEVWGNDYFTVSRKGLNFWDSFIFFTLKPEKALISDLIADYDYNENRSSIVFNWGGKFETHFYIYPMFYTDEIGEPVFLYDNLEDSLNDGNCTVFLGVNATFPEYNVFDIVGVITGFSTLGTETPNEINIVLSSIWWIMFLLLLVKIFIG